MQSRNFGKRCHLQVNPVSIGAMRFPQDLDEAVELIRYAIDHGMRYIDTSRGYGDSEIKLGEALKDGYRDKVLLSTKWSPWIMKVEDDDNPSADCTRKRIEESMQRLQVDYLDFYQVWNINNTEEYQQAIAPGNMVDGIRKAIDEGLVGHTGFTAHAAPELVHQIIDEAEWAEIMLLAYHMMNHRYAECLKHAHEKGIGTVVMNPLAGGKFGENSSVFKPIISDIGCVSVADTAVRYVFGNPYIDTFINGISKIKDVNDTIASITRGKLEPEQIKILDDFIHSRSRQEVNFCTRCGYCMPCPHEVNIPHIMDALFDYEFQGFEQSATHHYNALERISWFKGKRATSCTECGECLPKCTQHLDIPNEMKKAIRLFE